MARHLAFVVLVSLFSLRAAAVELEVTVTVTHLNPDGFVEFKAESDEQGERATGHLTRVGETRRFTWDMGSAKQNIWYWWDTLDGRADLKIVVTGAPQTAVTLFEASCAHDGMGEVQVGKTLTVPVARLDRTTNHYRRNRGLPPYIVENPTGAITHIKECDEPHPRSGGGKGGEEWEAVLESATVPTSSVPAPTNVATTPSPSVSRMGPLEEGRVYLQADIYSRPAGSADECARVCSQDARCKAMTYIKSQQICWIKDSVPGSAASAGMVSARKLTQVPPPRASMGPLQAGTAYLHADSYSRAVNSAEECSRVCFEDDACKAMTFIKSQRVCWIKNAVPASAPSDDMISAVKLN